METPDGWCIVRNTAIKTGEITYHVFASWSGGYTFGDSWKLSSGISAVSTVDRDFYRMRQVSGNVYKLHKNCGRISVYNQGVLQSIIHVNALQYVLEVIEIEDFLKEIEGKIEKA